MRKSNTKKDKRTVASIDPGISGTGYAIWQESDWKRCVPPVFCGNMYGRGLDWEERAYSLTMQVEELVKDHKVHTVYCEYPQHFESLTGRTAEAGGDIIKLAVLVGMFKGMCQFGNWLDFRLITPNDWKGQLPKPIVEARVCLRLPTLDKSKIKSHTWDAIGIGLYAKGYFKCQPRLKRR
jgi:hypothetical protein